MVTHVGSGQGGGVRHDRPRRTRHAATRREGAVVTTSTRPHLVGYFRDQLQTPLTLIGGFFRMCVLTGKALFRWPFQWREFILQCWFIMRVAFLPTIMVSIPLTVLLIFTLNVLLAQFGAADLSGAGAAIGAVTQLGPLTTVLVVAGAGSTAICADLGARTIREEIDAMEVLGIDPIHRLVVPRVDRRDARRHAAQRPGDHRRPGGRLPLRRVPAERLGRRLPRDVDHASPACPRWSSRSSRPRRSD